MLKIVGSFIAGIVFTGVLAWNAMGGLMFNETVSPFGVEETVARIQHNIQAAGNGWALSGLRNPAKAVQADGGNTLPVMINVDDEGNATQRTVLIEDGVLKGYMQDRMNAGLMGKMFGPLVGDIMGKVAQDQKKFLVMDPDKPAPPLILPKAGGEGGGGGGGGGSGC